MIDERESTRVTVVLNLPNIPFKVEIDGGLEMFAYVPASCRIVWRNR